MQKNIVKILLLLIAFNFILIPMAFAQEKTKIAIIGLEAKVVGQEMADIISDTIAVEVSNLGNFQVITKGDMRAMLDLESQKQLMGCDDVSCIAEIGGALGVDKIISGSLGKFGETFILNISLVNVSHAEVENRVSERVTGKIDKLLDALKPMMIELLGEKPIAPIAKIEKREEKKERVLTGNLKIESVKGAEIYLDGKRVGEAPSILRDINVGKHTLRVEKKGYVMWEKEVTVKADKNILIKANLIAVTPKEIKLSKGEIAEIKKGRKRNKIIAYTGLGIAIGGGIAAFFTKKDADRAYDLYKERTDQERINAARGRYEDNKLYNQISIGVGIVGAGTAIISLITMPKYPKGFKLSFSQDRAMLVYNLEY